MDVNDHFPSDSPPPRRWPRVLVTLAAFLVVVVVVSSHIELNYYVLTPGVAQPVAPLVTVPSQLDHPLDGTLLLTDVYVSQVTLLDYVPDVLNGDAQVLSAATLLGPYTPPDQLTEQGYIEMAQSQSAAKAAALTRLGYTVTQKGVGAMLFAVEANSPASSHLKVGQIITAVNGVPTTDACAVVAALHPEAPGTTVRLSVEQSVVTTRAVVRSGPTVVQSIRLGKAPSHQRDTASGCPGVHGPPRSYLGVVLSDQVDFTYPVHVTISTSDIGGPSAGLAMTLGIVDKLGGGRITGGRRVAATGTIDPQGQVGDVGGVAQKTIAVERAGATVFFVPPQEYQAAKSKDIPSLRVYPVTSLDQALSILHRLGGQLPATPGRNSAPSTGG
jgi:PDZ domain-containing protein